MAVSGGEGTERVQIVVVMRHGDRIDHFGKTWPLQAERPWDPPLTEEGKARAWSTGWRGLAAAAHLGFPIHRVLVSPFLRCLQTAREVVSALCADAAGEPAPLSADSGRRVPVDPSRVKVSIELGLCEMLSMQAIPTSPKHNQEWFPQVSLLELELPTGTVDHSVQRIYQELPSWGESPTAARNRFRDVILTAADKYPTENLLLISHGECVDVSASEFLGGREIAGVDYCGYSRLQRKIMIFPAGEGPDAGPPLTAEPFELLAEGCAGIHFNTLPD